jgi:hypothetical protein
MSTYIVSVTRISYASRDIEISAASEDEAMEMAIETCGDYEYSEKDAEYSINQISKERE